MNRKRIDMDAILKRYLPRASQELADEGSERTLARIREALQRREAEFGGPVDNRAFNLEPMQALVLNATELLGNEARSPRIKVKVEEISLKPASSLSVSSALNMMELRGLIKAVEIPAENGARRSYYYKLTPNGRFALSQAKLAAREATDAIGDLI